MNRDARKPENLRPNATPADGYVLAVDGKFKTRYETASEAMAAGSRLKQNFPIVQVAVFDATKRTYMPLELQGSN